MKIMMFERTACPFYKSHVLKNDSEGIQFVAEEWCKKFEIECSEKNCPFSTMPDYKKSKGKYEKGFNDCLREIVKGKILENFKTDELKNKISQF
jgi:hypothetical protein